MLRWWANKSRGFTDGLMCLGAILAAVVGLLGPVFHAHATAQGDGMLVYGEGTVVTPRYRTLSGTTWSAESSLPTAGAAVSYNVVRAAPTRTELLAGVVNTAGTLTIYRWNGAAWSNEWTVATGLGGAPRFDIAYEQSSGKAVVLYSRNIATTNELASRIWDGASWTVATNLDAVRTSGIVQYIRLEPRSGTDELAAVWGDANFDLSANYFDGANAVWKGEPAAALETVLAAVGTGTIIASRNFDLAFEQTSGELLIVWGNNSNSFPSYVTRTAGTGGAWGTATTTGATFKVQGLDIQLASEPGTNYIAYANQGNFSPNSGTEFAEAAMWTGSAWANINNYDNTTSLTAASLIRTAVTWLQSGAQSRAVVTYDDAAASGIDWLSFNKNTTTWSAVQTDYTGAPAPSATGAAGAMYLARNPFNLAEATYTTVDGQNDLFTKKITFDGTNLTWSSTESGGVSPETSTATKVGWAASFAYNAFVPAAGALSVDVVDASGVTVASPSLSMSATAASGLCQTTTGTLGVTAQKIRVNNTTLTPGWSLSIAATAGAAGSWSSGGATYDFNDPSGGTAGCADGADADTLPGQLSVDPSASTITPQSGCATTGLTKGTASAFSQAVADSITLANASVSAATNCFWDIASISLSQKVPELQPSGSYNLLMTVTIVAN